MIVTLYIVIGVVCASTGFFTGYIVAHRRLPTTLARMTEGELAQLAAQTAARRVFPSPAPLPTLDERNAAALRASRENAIFRREQNL